MSRLRKVIEGAASTVEERRERRQLRRELQRSGNIKRAAKMRVARRRMEAVEDRKISSRLNRPVYVGCSGWRYWKWRDSFYANLAQEKWFEHYSQVFDTVEINASFYSWPTVANVQAWRRQARDRDFVYTVKVCELITHVKRFKGTKTLIRDFGMIADILGDRMGCFLFQLPPSYHFTEARLRSIVRQLDPARRNVVEFRHKTWWNAQVFRAFRKAGIVFCSCSGPRLPDDLVRTADEIYLRLHGPLRWYRHDYSDDELKQWADRIKASGAKRAWIYFNNDYEAKATTNALSLLGLISPAQKTRHRRTRIEE
ncbi:DUF72 domain-containing protein [Bradyrhizobium sp. SYSU BS000235]|uniref:DUF72 domain-containing protein n=1 Tax=Bradyrhizobium sp. SYSU BS000235 TaxID=3411332 RepID=UPI003C76618D